jgi:predicted peroxiredoxin
MAWFGNRSGWPLYLSKRKNEMKKKESKKKKKKKKMARLSAVIKDCDSQGTKYCYSEQGHSLTSW